MDNITRNKLPEEIKAITIKQLLDEIIKINKTINYILELIKTRNF